MDFVFSAADIMLPHTDMKKWATIACDQYTSEPEYWEKVEKTVGDAPSSLRLVLPEVYLRNDNSEQVKKINQTMKKYEEDGIFETYKDALIYVERTQSDGKVRRGIVGKIDLEQYDYSKKTSAAVRATEKTVISRIPPRVKIREDATLELPHVMLLIDDPERTVIEPLDSEKDKFRMLYDFDMMLGAGHITGRLMDGENIRNVIGALKDLSDKNDGFLLSVGDGNHSLASAKECYNKTREPLSRYALVEIVNIHDEALQFEPIYRAVFGAEPEKLINDFVDFCGGEYQGADAQSFECLYKDKTKHISVKPSFKLPVGTLQSFLDDYTEKNTGITVDYIHGEDSLKKIASRDEKAVGFLFRGMEKSELFSSVSADGSLPRKTFSMGHADDKRFYLEARRIK